jgi:hypothetical protein
MRISIWSVLCLLMTFIACKSDSKDTNYGELIIGRWEIVEALRNGRPTETLTGAFLEFLPKGRMNSNIGGMQGESAYTIEGNVISSKSERLPVDYNILHLGDSSLVLKFALREMPFQISLVRAPELPAE